LIPMLSSNIPYAFVFGGLKSRNLYREHAHDVVCHCPSRLQHFARKLRQLYFTMKTTLAIGFALLAPSSATYVWPNNQDSLDDHLYLQDGYIKNGQLSDRSYLPVYPLRSSALTQQQKLGPAPSAPSNLEYKRRPSGCAPHSMIQLHTMLRPRLAD
jgi:hypothetical protein